MNIEFKQVVKQEGSRKRTLLEYQCAECETKCYVRPSRKDKITGLCQPCSARKQVFINVDEKRKQIENALGRSVFQHGRYRSVKVTCSGCGKERRVRVGRYVEGSDLCQRCTVARRNALDKEIRCRSCGVELTPENEVRYGKRGRRTAYCVTCEKMRLRQKRQNNKQLVFDHFGGRCACCGESNYAFLTIDHVNGDGSSHRLNGGMGDKLYARLVRNNFKSEYALQILCWNCNLAKHIYGVCPHQQ